MSVNLRPYRAIRHALTQGYPGEPQGQCARHVVTLAVLISDIVGHGARSKRAQALSQRRELSFLDARRIPLPPNIPIRYSNSLGTI